MHSDGLFFYSIPSLLVSLCVIPWNRLFNRAANSPLISVISEICFLSSMGSPYFGGENWSKPPLTPIPAHSTLSLKQAFQQIFTG